MPSSSQLLSALAAVFTSVNAAMGPYFSTGPVASNSFIRESIATLVLPNAPSGNSGDLSLWVGMGTSNGDLIQSIAEIWQSTDWSVYAYTLLSTGGQHPVQGPSSTAKPGNQVTMHCKERVSLAYEGVELRDTKHHLQISLTITLEITSRRFSSTVKLSLHSQPAMATRKGGAAL